MEYRYYYVLDFERECCDIFYAPYYDSSYDIEDMLIEKGYNLDDIEYMISETLNYNISVSDDNEVKNTDTEEDLIDWEY